MRSVKFYSIKASLHSILCPVNKVCLYLFYLFYGKSSSSIAAFRRCSYRLYPIIVDRRSFISPVMKLTKDLCSVSVDAIGEIQKLWYRCVSVYMHLE